MVYGVHLWRFARLIVLPNIDLLTAGDKDPIGDRPIGGRASTAAPQNHAVIMLMHDVQHRQNMPMLMHH